MSEARLREVNRIPPRMLVKAGSTLLVPRSEKTMQEVAGHIADNASMALAPEGPALRRVSIRAGKKGDSVAAVTRRYRVSAARWCGGTALRRKRGSGRGQNVTVMLAAARTRTVHPKPSRPGERIAAR